MTCFRWQRMVLAMHDAAKLLQEIAATIARHMPADGERVTAIRNLYLGRTSVPDQPYFTVQWPCFALVAQGAKSVALGASTTHYGVGDYLVISADLPVSSSVTQATRARPNLGIGLALDPQRIAAVLDRSPIPPSTAAATCLAVHHATPAILDATLRLVRLLDRPDDIPALAPLVEEELAYHLLRSPCGERLLHLVAQATGEGRAHAAARWLRTHYTEPLHVDRLARHAGMSVSSLHHHFKALTGLSPLQYQKQLRLHEARRILSVEGVDVTTAGLRVGYASPSQFSREYSRLFGASPRDHRAA